MLTKDADVVSFYFIVFASDVAAVYTLYTLLTRKTLKVFMVVNFFRFLEIGFRETLAFLFSVRLRQCTPE